MSPPTGEATPRGTETILLVEPDPETRTLGAFMLTRLGYSVLEAHNAMEALTIYDERGSGVDLLLAEALMPRVNGHELAKLLSARDAAMRTLFLADEGYERLARRVAAQKSVLFLVRPFTMRVLAAKVRKALDVPAGQAKTTAA
jgi:two-component system, cell cycle sensor histidine kinase and response regulator CckA